MIVQVSDIKRANGILSDNAIFARELIKIPTAQLPIG
jgi:LysM repeat protein